MTPSERRERILRELSGSSLPADSCFIGGEAALLIIAYGPDVMDELESIMLSHVEGTADLCSLKGNSPPPLLCLQACMLLNGVSISSEFEASAYRNSY